MGASFALMLVKNFDDSSAAVKARHNAATAVVASTKLEKEKAAAAAAAGFAMAEEKAEGTRLSSNNTPSPALSYSSTASSSSTLETAEATAAAAELAFHEQHWLSKASAAIKLFWYSTECKLLAPLNITFGFAAALLQYYANKSIVTDQLQPVNSTQSYVGYAASVAVGTGTLTALVFGFLTVRIGKRVPMMLGNIMFFVMALAFLVIPVEQLGTWSAVVPLYMIYGIGTALSHRHFVLTRGPCWCRHGPP